VFNLVTLNRFTYETKFTNKLKQQLEKDLHHFSNDRAKYSYVKHVRSDLIEQIKSEVSAQTDENLRQMFMESMLSYSEFSMIIDLFHEKHSQSINAKLNKEFLLQRF